MPDMGAIAIIPARGGSKRIPRKNIRPFLGEPIISYSIKAAINSQLFDEVMVSTDDAEIAEIAMKYGAKVPFMRSAQNSNDFAGTADVMLEVLDAYKNMGRTFETACCIYPTAVFVSPEKLSSAKKLLESHSLDCVFPVLPFSYPIQRALRIRDGKVSYFYPEFSQSRSQDLESAYQDAGQFYFFRVDSLYRTGKMMGQNTAPIIISELEAQDIDNESDWKLAELKFKMFI